MRRSLLGTGVALLLSGCYLDGGQTGSRDLGITEVDDGECVADTTTIFAGQHIDAGDVEVSSDGTDLIVGISGDNGWLVSEYHVYAGTDPVPVGKSGAPAPGQFPYKAELDEPVASIDVRIPLAGLAVECGDSLNVAVHTVMVLIEDGVVVDTQTGWGYGPNEYRRQWGWWFTTDICCEPPPDGCVRSKSAWRLVPDLWPLDSFTVGGVVYTKEEALALLFTSSDDLGGDASVDLFHQMIPAMLNIADGATPDADTAAALAEADAWMVTYADADGTVPFGVLVNGWGVPPDAGYEDGQALKWAIHAFNHGMTETPTCDPEYR